MEKRTIFKLSKRKKDENKTTSKENPEKKQNKLQWEKNSRIASAAVREKEELKKKIGKIEIKNKCTNQEIHQASKSNTAILFAEVLYGR